jgi:hypothetical protein
MIEAFDGPAFFPPAFIPDAFVAPQGVGAFRFSSAGYATGPAETPASTPFVPAILGDVDLAQSAFDAVAIGGRTALGVAEIELSDRGALRDAVRFGTADGRVASVRVARVTEPRARNRGTPLALSTLAFRGVVRTISDTSAHTARVALSDLTDRLTAPLQSAIYAGTGGLEGGAELKGRPKPVALGQLYNVPAIFLGNVDLGVGALPTYQVSWRAIDGIDAIRVRGVAQTIVGGTPTPGQARVFLASACFQLGGSPDGDVGADIRGDVGSAYVNSTAGTLRRLLESLGPQLSAAEIDADAFGFADLDLPGVVGFWQGAEPTSALAAADAIVAGCGAILAGGRSGAVRLVDPIARPDALQFDIPAPWAIECEPLALPATLSPRPRAVAVAWRRNWRPLANAAGSVPAADRERLAQAESLARYISAAVTARVAQERELRFPGLYFDEAAALARATAFGDWIAAGPRAIRLVTDRYLDQIEIGHVGRVTYPAFGLDGGIRGVVVGWRESLSRRRVEIILVGIPA